MQRDSVSPHQPAVTAESLSSFFLSKVEAIRACTAQCTPPKFIDQQNSNLDEFLPCTMTEIRQVIRCSPAKSCDLDPVLHRLFMESREQLFPFIHLNCNTSLRDGVLPDAKKHANVTPILKKADLDPDNTKSYKPISNLSFVSKLNERLVSHRLTSYLSQHNLLPTLQSAYRQNHSTETATLKVVSDALDAADTGQITLLAMLDLSAAFDTIDHATLLERLQRSYGIDGMVLKWIKSFNSNRVQTVIFADVKTASVALLHGVPQGSVLEPLLFNLYILLMSSALPSHLTSAFIATLMTFSCMSVALLLTHLLLWPVYLRASR